jgi:hypothetical protein
MSVEEHLSLPTAGKFRITELTCSSYISFEANFCVKILLSLEVFGSERFKMSAPIQILMMRESIGG